MRARMFSVEDIAAMIDVSAVQAFHGETEIRELVARARERRFVAVHVLPCWVSMLRSMLPKTEGILVGSPVGFPGGGHKTAVKVIEAGQLETDGVDEMDMMINVGKARSGEWSYVEDDIRAVVESVGIPVKVILEVHYMSETQIRTACDICIKAGAEYVKTSTGWADSGASLKVIELITSHVGEAIKVKAAGGVRDLKTLLAMREMGVSRFGINLQASVSILNEVARLTETVADARKGGYREAQE